MWEDELCGRQEGKRLAGLGKWVKVSANLVDRERIRHIRRSEAEQGAESRHFLSEE